MRSVSGHVQIKANQTEEKNVACPKDVADTFRFLGLLVFTMQLYVQ